MEQCAGYQHAHIEHLDTEQVSSHCQHCADLESARLNQMDPKDFAQHHEVCSQQEADCVNKMTQEELAIHQSRHATQQANRCSFTTVVHLKKNLVTVTRFFGGPLHDEPNQVQHQPGQH
mgnify:CR=1 FL=1